MVTGKQRAYLRGLANNIQPIFQVGKGGTTDNVIKQFDDALEAREIVKAAVLRNSEEPPKVLAEKIAGATEAEVIQVIGNKFVLYRESKEKKTIVLP